MNTNRYRLLLVEDESSIRNFIRTVLETNDYQVLTAGTCQQALMMFSSHIPDLVILDLGLPDQDGLEFIRRIWVPMTISPSPSVQRSCWPGYGWRCAAAEILGRRMRRRCAASSWRIWSSIMTGAWSP